MSNKQQLAILISKLFQATQTSERQLLEHQLKTLEENFDQHV